MKLSSTIGRRACMLLSFVLACSGKTDDADVEGYTNLVPFDTANVRLITSRETTTVVVELAETSDQHTMGLMERRQLASNAGMLFIYPSVQPESSAFWMFRTRIPLDIAFIDSAGGIRTIQTMTPCTSTLAQGCTNYPAGARYLAALEVNAGYFARNGVRVGDRVVLSDTTTRRRASRPPT